MDKLGLWTEYAIATLGLIFHGAIGGKERAVRWFAGWNLRMLIKQRIEDREIALLERMIAPNAPLDEIMGIESVRVFTEHLRTDHVAIYREATRAMLEAQRPLIEAVLVQLKVNSTT